MTKMFLVIFADVNIFYLFIWVNRDSIFKTKKSKNFVCFLFGFQIKENVLVLKSGFVFLLFLFKTLLDLNSCDFLFLVFFLFS